MNTNATPSVPRIAYGLAEAAESLGISRRTLERMRSAGKFPKPDARAGKRPLWRPETITGWLEQGGAP
jgi:predicted DNA-binding transcriptional regulator AlpA